MFGPYKAPEPEPEPDEGPDFWRLRGMGFSESEAREILYLCIPVHKFISLVEVRKCPPHLALEILR